MDYYISIITKDSTGVDNLAISIDLTGVILIISSIFGILFLMYKIIKKNKEISETMNNYIDERIDIKVIPLAKKIEKAHKRIDDIDKLELPIQLAKINTILESLKENIKDGFNRIEKRLNK